jgi:hypothetical protein
MWLYTGYVDFEITPDLISHTQQGQGSNQQRLSSFCSQSTVDVIPIGFVDVFPGQTLQTNATALSMLDWVEIPR